MAKERFLLNNGQIIVIRLLLVNKKELKDSCFFKSMEVLKLKKGIKVSFLERLSEYCS